MVLAHLYPGKKKKKEKEGTKRQKIEKIKLCTQRNLAWQQNKAPSRKKDRETERMKEQKRKKDRKKKRKSEKEREKKKERERPGKVAHACHPSTLGGQVVWISGSGVLDQPGKNVETLSLLKVQKLAGRGGRRL